MKNKKHLPFYGVGPIYCVSIIAVSIIGIILSKMGIFNDFKLFETKVVFIIIGICIFLFGFWVWYKGAFKIDKYIKSNQLCTDGIYGLVRNPCYSGIMLMCTGALFIENNIILLVLPPIYWLYMTVLMKNTEEKWLFDLYGKEYIDYCKNVNRCIPFPKRLFRK